MSGGHGHEQEHAPGLDALHATHASHSGLEATHGAAELGGLLHHLPTAGGVGGMGLGLLGMPLGGFTFLEGIDNVQKGNTSQGVLDMTAGALGTASGFTSLVAGGSSIGSELGVLSTVAPPLAVAAGLAGLGAYGNEYSESHGWYGENYNGGNADFLGSIGNTAGGGWQLGKDAGTELLGDNWAGASLGYGLGAASAGLGGGGQLLMNSGAAITGGVARGWDAITSW